MVGTRSVHEPVCSSPGFTTRRFRALDHRFVVDTEDPALGRYLEHVLAGLASEDDSSGPIGRYRVARLQGGDGVRHALFWEDTNLLTSAHPSLVLQRLLWHINRSVVTESGRHLLIHAAGVTKSGRGMVLPAARNAGKTTLAAGLVQRGFGYLSDETVAIDSRSRRALSYAKPLSIDPGSWSVLADLRPELQGWLADLHREHWQVPVTAIRHDAVTDSSPIDFVVTPEYRSEEPTQLRALPRAQAVRVVAEHAFNFRGFPDGLNLLAGVVRGARCYELTVGSLPHACELLDELISESPMPERGLR